jgi:hypothetical protein
MASERRAAYSAAGTRLSGIGRAIDQQLALLRDKFRQGQLRDRAYASTSNGLRARHIPILVVAVLWGAVILH